MIHADESDEQAEDPAFIRQMLGRLVPYPERVDVIRHRLYTHHSRIAGAFRGGRLLLAGRCRAPDAGLAGTGLQQRHPRRGEPGLEACRRGQRSGRRRVAGYLRRRAPQARTGDDRPVHHGRTRHLADQPPRCGAAGLHDAVRVNCADRSSDMCWRCGSSRCPATSRALSSTPTRGGTHRRSGRCSCSPASTPASESNVLLDDVLGSGFAVMCWNNNPRALLGPDAFDGLESIRSTPR